VNSGRCRDFIIIGGGWAVDTVGKTKGVLAILGVLSLLVWKDGTVTLSKSIDGGMYRPM